MTRPRLEEAPGNPAGAAGGEDLLLLVVRTADEPFAAVIGSTGGRAGALVVPTEITLSVPGQGDARLDDALELPVTTATTTVANLLGLWIDHYAILGRARLAALVDRMGGLEVAGQTMTGDEVVASLEGPEAGRTLAFELALKGLLASEAPWEEGDLAETDDAGRALEILGDAEGSRVADVEVKEPADGVWEATPDAVRDGLVSAFGGPNREAVKVIVLNGSGTPGIGEAVARRIVPDGFSVVVSENASTFDHRRTLVVVGSSADVGLAERVRDLLGTGTVNVSVPSGLAPVTIVVGKDFGTG
jgi:LytR cell envelope-related transcriptional attenuator